MKKEAVFSYELRTDLEKVFNKHIFVYLVPNMIRTGKKPMDFMFLYNGCHYAIECKYIHGNSINLKYDIRPHQPESLRKIIFCGGVGFFVIGFHDYKVAYACSPDGLDYLSEMCEKDSISYELFERVCSDSERIIKIRRLKIIGETRWEVEKLVKC